MRKIFISLFALVLIGVSCSPSDDADDSNDIGDATVSVDDPIVDAGQIDDIDTPPTTLVDTDPVNNAEELAYENLAKEIIYGALEEQEGEEPPDTSIVGEPLATTLSIIYYLPSNTVEEYERRNEDVSSCYWRGAANGLFALTLEVAEDSQSGLTPTEMETIRSTIELGRASLNIDADFECLIAE